MNTSSAEHDPGFPWFEENNFNGWLIQFKAHLRKVGAHVVLNQSRPADVDAAGVPIPMNAQQRRALVDQQAGYDKLDNIAYSELMKAFRANPKTKNLTETGGFNTTFDILHRLRQRYNNVDEMSKAAHLLHYHSLKQLEGESGAEFVDQEQRENLALQQMGINVDDSLRLTKFMQQGTTNSKHRSLAQTIFSTPNMTLGKATSLFETYTPAEPSSSNVSVNDVICYFCRKKGHTAQNCQKKKRHPKKKRDQLQPKDQKSSLRKTVTKRQRFFCVICESTGVHGEQK